jgi:hypothetical protein
MHPAILAPMRQHSPALRFAAALAVLLTSAGLGVFAGCGPDQDVSWICLNPVTGKIDGSYYDTNHVVNGVVDPCHCYDPCGPLKSCPIVVDAGTPPPGCDVDAGDGG